MAVLAHTWSLFVFGSMAQRSARLQVKDDGINISNWLQSLAKFTGAVCRKCVFCTFLDLVPFSSPSLRNLSLTLGADQSNQSLGLLHLQVS